MKKLHKTTLGLLGLAFVLCTTAFAISLPTPAAMAADVEINVNVVNTPSINITSPTDGATLTEPTQDVNFDYVNVDDLTVTVTQTKPNGEVVTFNIPVDQPTGEFGSGSVKLDLYKYGAGDFVVKIKGTTNGTPIERTIFFHYAPIEVPNTGSFLGNLNAAHADYLVTALGLIAVFGLTAFIYFRRKKEQR